MKNCAAKTNFFAR